MRFNTQHYKKYWRAAGRTEKDGVFDVTRFPNGRYCFATRQRLGPNGEIDSHPLLNKRVLHKETGDEYVIDSVCIHWMCGYYYSASLKDSNNSHAMAMIGNINCQTDFILEYISDFNINYEILI